MIKHLLIQTALVSVLILPSASAQATTLGEAVTTALETHPLITGAEAQVGASKADRQIAYSKYFPTIGASITAGRFYADTTTTRGLTTDRGAGYSGLFEYNTTLKQPIFDGFATQNTVKATKLRQEASMFGLLDVKDQVAVRAATAYLNVLRTKESLRLARQHYARVVDYKQRIDLMAEKGAASDAEKRQMANLESTIIRLATELESEFEASKAEYNAVIGMMPDDLKDPIFKVTEPAKMSQDDLLGWAMNNHPSLMLAKLQGHAADYDVDATRGSYLPRLDAELSYLERDQRDIVGGEATDARGVVKLSWEFATGGTLGYQINKAKHTASQARASAEEQRRNIEQGVRTAFTNYQASYRLKETADKTFDDTSALLKTEKQQFEGGSIPLLQVAGTANQAFQSHLEKLNAEFLYESGYLNLLASMGQITNFFDGTGTTMPKNVTENTSQEPKQPSGS